MGYLLLPGDEVVFVRRRTVEVEKPDAATGQPHKVQQVENQEFGAVRCPENLEILSGSAGIEWVEEPSADPKAEGRAVKYFTARWKCA